MHELRVPLTVISGYVQLLRLGALAPEMRSRALASVERGVQQQLDLFSDLYAVSDILTGLFTLRREPADLAAVIGAAVEDVRRSEEEGIPLDVTLASTATVFIDYGRLQWAVRTRSRWR
jgi:two-component system OmpR family sensor kinase